MSASDADMLLETARDLCEQPRAELVGRWARAVAMLTRAALEITVDEFWRRSAPGMAEVGGARPKMLCLPTYLGDVALARDTYQSWASLSRACHRHAYELDPTTDDLLRWISHVEDLRAAVGAHSASATT